MKLTASFRVTATSIGPLPITKPDTFVGKR